MLGKYVRFAMVWHNNVGRDRVERGRGSRYIITATCNDIRFGTLLDLRRISIFTVTSLFQ